MLACCAFYFNRESFYLFRPLCGPDNKRKNQKLFCPPKMCSVVIVSTNLDMQQDIFLPYGTEKMCRCAINQSYGVVMKRNVCTFLLNVSTKNLAICSCFFLSVANCWSHYSLYICIEHAFITNKWLKNWSFIIPKTIIVNILCSFFSWTSTLSVLYV